MSFAEATFKGVIEEEENTLQSRSSLRLFGRLDIGLVEYEPHKLNYWANELDRTQNAALWAREVGHKVDNLVNSFVQAIPGWLTLGPVLATN